MTVNWLKIGLQWMPGRHSGLQAIAIGPAPLRPDVRWHRPNVFLMIRCTLIAQ